MIQKFRALYNKYLRVLALTIEENDIEDGYQHNYFQFNLIEAKQLRHQLDVAIRAYEEDKNG